MSIHRSCMMASTSLTQSQSLPSFLFLYWLSHPSNVYDLIIVISVMLTSRLYYCNSFYLGLLFRLIWTLQLVQNAAACLLMELLLKISIQPVLHQLHWLPIEYQICVTIMGLTFKALYGLHICRTASPDTHPAGLYILQNNTSWLCPTPRMSNLLQPGPKPFWLRHQPCRIGSHEGPAGHTTVP